MNVIRRRPAKVLLNRGHLPTELQKLFAITPRMRAHANFESARGEYHAATLALMNMEPGCEARADRALAMLNEARAALQRIEDAEE